jgi:hypothetical protein
LLNKISIVFSLNLTGVYFIPFLEKKIFYPLSFKNKTTSARLFRILDKVIHWIRLSTGQLPIQWLKIG